MKTAIHLLIVPVLTLLVLSAVASDAHAGGGWLRSRLNPRGGANPRHRTWTQPRGGQATRHWAAPRLAPRQSGQVRALESIRNRPFQVSSQPRSWRQQFGPLATNRPYYPRLHDTSRYGYLHRPRNGLPAFGAPSANGLPPTHAERLYTRHLMATGGRDLNASTTILNNSGAGRYASNARQATQATQARQARQYQQYRIPAWNQRGR